MTTGTNGASRLADVKSTPQRTANRLVHPLSAADPITLAQVVWRNGPPRLARAPQLVTAAAAAVGRVPFTMAECAYVRARRIDHRPIRSPIFIIGHWRSGTTHLYNILSKSPNLGYVPPVAAGLPWDFLLLGRLLHPLLKKMLPQHRYVDDIPVTPESPQEDETALACMQPISFFHGFYFSKRLTQNMKAGVFLDGCTEAQVRRRERRWIYFLRKLTWLQHDRCLVIKNPSYTARVAQICRLFPDARFIHIHRNPFEVYQSMRRLYAELTKQFSLQKSDAEQVDELIFTVYERMMRQLIKDSADLPADRFVEIAYKDLDEAPMQTLEQICRSLKLDNWEEAKPSFEAYLATVRPYRKRHYEMSPAMIAKVRQRWGPLMARWGYTC